MGRPEKARTVKTDDHVYQYWLESLSDFLAGAVDLDLSSSTISSLSSGGSSTPRKRSARVAAKSKLLLNQLPNGYSLRETQYPDTSFKITLLFGHPSGLPFRTPTEFAPHLQWLLTKTSPDTLTNTRILNKCSCRLCSTLVSEQLELITRSIVPVLRDNVKHPIHVNSASQTFATVFHLGEVVWVPLLLNLDNQDSGSASDKAPAESGKFIYWPAHVRSRHLSAEDAAPSNTVSSCISLAETSTGAKAGQPMGASSSVDRIPVTSPFFKTTSYPLQPNYTVELVGMSNSTEMVTVSQKNILPYYAREWQSESEIRQNISASNNSTVEWLINTHRNAKQELKQSFEEWYTFGKYLIETAPADDSQSSTYLKKEASDVELKSGDSIIDNSVIIGNSVTCYAGVRIGPELIRSTDIVRIRGKPGSEGSEQDNPQTRLMVIKRIVDSTKEEDSQEDEVCFIGDVYVPITSANKNDTNLNFRLTNSRVELPLLTLESTDVRVGLSDIEGRYYIPWNITQSASVSRRRHLDNLEDKWDDDMDLIQNWKQLGKCVINPLLSKRSSVDLGFSGQDNETVDMINENHKRVHSDMEPTSPNKKLKSREPSLSDLELAKSTEIHPCPYVECAKAFADAHSLDLHIKIVHSELPQGTYLRCTDRLCKLSFETIGGFKHHCQVVHGIMASNIKEEAQGADVVVLRLNNDVVGEKIFVAGSHSVSSPDVINDQYVPPHVHPEPVFVREEEKEHDMVSLESSNPNSDTEEDMNDSLDKDGSQAPDLAGEHRKYIVRKRFSTAINAALEKVWEVTNHPSQETKEQLVVETGLKLTQIANWFAQRRAQQKKQHLQPANAAGPNLEQDQSRQAERQESGLLSASHNALHQNSIGNLSNPVPPSMPNEHSQTNLNSQNVQTLHFDSEDGNAGPRRAYKKLTQNQLLRLEECYNKYNPLTELKKEEIARELGLEARVVRSWLANRRKGIPKRLEKLQKSLEYRNPQPHSASIPEQPSHPMFQHQPHASQPTDSNISQSQPSFYGRTESQYNVHAQNNSEAYQPAPSEYRTDTTYFFNPQQTSVLEDAFIHHPYGNSGMITDISRQIQARQEDVAAWFERRLYTARRNYESVLSVLVGSQNKMTVEDVLLTSLCRTAFPPISEFSRLSAETRLSVGDVSAWFADIVANSLHRCPREAMQMEYARFLANPSGTDFEVLGRAYSLPPWQIRVWFENENLTRSRASSQHQGQQVHAEPARPNQPQTQHSQSYHHQVTSNTPQVPHQTTVMQDQPTNRQLPVPHAATIAPLTLKWDMETWGRMKAFPQQVYTPSWSGGFPNVMACQCVVSPLEFDVLNARFLEWTQNIPTHIIPSVEPFTINRLEPDHVALAQFQAAMDRRQVASPAFLSGSLVCVSLDPVQGHERSYYYLLDVLTRHKSAAFVHSYNRDMIFYAGGEKIVGFIICLPHN